MTDPPDPGIPALLLAVAARLGFRVTTRDPNGTELGMFIEGGAQWTAKAIPVEASDHATR